MRRELAKIKATSLGYEDHGIFTAYLTVDYAVGTQGVGGYALDRYDKPNDRRIGTAYGHEWIIRVLRACGVDRWEKLVGRTIWVLQDESKPAGFGNKVIGIENLETEPGERFLFADLEVKS